MRITTGLLVTVLMSVVLVSAGCSGHHWGRSKSSKAGGGPTLTELRGGPAQNIKVVEKTIPRAQLSAAIDLPHSINTFRLVQVFNGSGDTAMPEYRLFDVRQGGLLELLGLQSADIIVGANDHPIDLPSKFGVYLSMLRNEKDAQIEIVREGDPLLMKYIFE